MLKRSVVALQPLGWDFSNLGVRHTPTPVPPRDEWWGKDAGGAGTHVMGSKVDLSKKRVKEAEGLSKMTEMRMAKKFEKQLQEGTCSVPDDFLHLSDAQISVEDAKLIMKAAVATSLVHVESRVASSFGLGFYTIGPGGEELVSSVGSILELTDGMALHYRHTAAAIARQLKSGKPLEDILLDRARGHVVSKYDPVTGGNHCAIGGTEYDFVVSSTLASQAPQAVGRALGASLAHQLKVPSKLSPNAVSFVSIGDGSVNHAQYLASLNLAEYASFRNFNCPTVFCVSDNGIAISYKGHDWLQKRFLSKILMEQHSANGCDIFDVYATTRRAVESARKKKKPVFLLYKNLPRRFGHAATDRQAAYLTPQEIESVAEKNPLEYAAAQLVRDGISTYEELAEMYADTWEKTKKAFDIAVNEPKVTSRNELRDLTSQPLWFPPTEADGAKSFINTPPNSNNKNLKPKDKHPMRKHMTRVFDELLTDNKECVYLGEDVEHGGYYLVTDGLARKHPLRVKDFPPEETMLVGAGIGYAQTGLLPIVEIPYAKYLDCGIDQYYEAAIMNWLTAGRQPCGMIIRLQGFDRGVFGGNFHTHNILSIPPGIDVVCYSNGPDYARGMRYALEQARNGRIVMSVDCTNALNNKHAVASDTDENWLMPYTKRGEMLTFDDVTVYGNPSARIAVITYGNGVLTSQEAAKELLAEGIEVKIIDSPYLSGISEGLVESISDVDAVVFADICKFGQHPFASIISSLQNRTLLPPRWQICAAQATYNPLGTYLTFLNVPDIVQAVKNVSG
eukprot:TRINITY_DN3358_c3_g1_i1.p1 TRINITY_DN3358_c3_g1~~TRINITY_DN3358_c3_g1_i1.p1  ORF type:complete len:811 (+),score=186.16 TRINITY_DN3358_c3_g1_i1:62-2434(+)